MTEVAQTIRERVDALEASMLSAPQIDCPVTERFIPGLYAREIRIPKGTTLIGAVHKAESIVVLSAGTLKLVTEDGVVEITAPHTLTCKPGAKNAAFAVEDAVWTNFFPTTETDPRKLVELLTYSTADELLGGPKNPQIVANKAAEIEA
jgi:hypothetical protein